MVRTSARGDPIKLNAADFERLSAALFAKLEKSFPQPSSSADLRRLMMQ